MPVLRGSSARPLFITAAGMAAAAKLCPELLPGKSRYRVATWHFGCTDLCTGEQQGGCPAALVEPSQAELVGERGGAVVLLAG